MQTLQDILYKVAIRSVSGPTGIAVSDICIDSRSVSSGSCFVAVKGVSADGHQYISQAIAQGAASVVCEQMPDVPNEKVTYVQVHNSAEAAGFMAHAFYGNVSAQLKVVGVTGTNGKTTVATLLYKLFSGLGYTCGLISTVQNQFGNEVVTSTHTTPDVINLNKLLRQMADAGCTYVFMECSSHAIHQQRIAGIRFAGALFSNITHDHLDYHKTFDEYIRVKKAFFDGLGSEAFAISNLDDKRGEVMLQNTKAKKLYYSLRSMADFKGKMIENSLNGLQMQINQDEVHFRLIGEFNAYNLLAVFGAAVTLGEDKQKILLVLSGITGAEGRFETIQSANDQVLGIIDYAHTPDALENVLVTLRRLRTGNERIITVVGCGGDRDKTKRPVMGSVACELSDQAIFTSDNPRSEDPIEILKNMEQELNAAARRKQLSVADRKEAIKTAIKLAGKGDIILVAGKGHEKYQEIKGVKYEFDDKQVVRELFDLLNR